MILEFEIAQRPVPKGRPRFGRGHAFTDARTRNYETMIKLLARQAVARTPGWPLDAQVRMNIAIYADRALVRLETLPPRKRASRADIDNCGKAIADACNGITYSDDRQIVELDIIDMGMEPATPKRKAG
jgi:Holliday junction resolvase RusA-like endonuclease